MPALDDTTSPPQSRPYRAWLAYCRPGFESECVQELAARAQALHLAGYPHTSAGHGYAAFVLTDDAASEAEMMAPMPIFARQLLLSFAHIDALSPGDRLSPVIEALVASRRQWHDVWIESPDSEAGRELAALCRGFGTVLRAGMRQHELLSAHASHRLHAFFATSRSLILAEADPQFASPWPGGIPRLRRLSRTPSRSAAKLDEALATMLAHDERPRLLKPGMTAVDLGAAPGGWSWLLAQRHLRVAAIDNGPLAPQVLETALVTHIRADGFTWRPSKPADWLVCDMVEQPSRVATLIGQWLAAGLCRYALFNLKLPMKKRYAETLRCLDLLRTAAGMPLDVRCRQLYHDREEVTVFALQQ